MKISMQKKHVKLLTLEGPITASNYIYGAYGIVLAAPIIKTNAK